MFASNMKKGDGIIKQREQNKRDKDQENNKEDKGGTNQVQVEP